MIKADTNPRQNGGLTPFYSIKSVIKGVVFSYIILIPAFIVLAAVYTYTPMPDSYLKPAIIVISILSIFLSGFMSSVRVRSKGWLHGIIAGLLYAIVRLITGLAVFGSYVPNQSVALTFIVTMLIAAAGGIAGVNFGSKSQRNY